MPQNISRKRDREEWIELPPSKNICFDISQSIDEAINQEDFLLEPVCFEPASDADDLSYRVYCRSVGIMTPEERAEDYFEKGLARLNHDPDHKQLLLAIGDFRRSAEKSFNHFGEKILNTFDLSEIPSLTYIILLISLSFSVATFCERSRLLFIQIIEKKFQNMNSSDQEIVKIICQKMKITSPASAMDVDEKSSFELSALLDSLPQIE